MALFSKRSFVGLDLGHYSLKAVQLEKTPGGWRVTKSATAPTPPDTLKDGVVIDPETMGAAIKRMLRDAGITATTATIAAAGGSLFVRPVPFPKMSEAALRKSIRFEASRYVPGSVEDSFVEFEIMGAINETQMNVLIVAAPKDIVDSRVQACEAAGLEVDIVDVEMFAAYRSMVEAYQDEGMESTMAIVDIGSSTTNMSVVDHGVFAMNRSIPNGGKALTDALKSYFKLSDEDAEQGKAQLDVSELLDEIPKENPPLRVLQPHLDDLVREVRRSLNYFQSQQTEGSDPKPVERLVLAGGGAKLPGIARYIEHKLGLPVQCAGVFDNPRFLQGTAAEDSGLELAVASGLAMRSLAKAA